MSKRWERRDLKLRAKRRRMPIHGKGMAVMYRNSLAKRLRELSERHKRMLVESREKVKRGHQPSTKGEKT